MGISLITNPNNWQNVYNEIVFNVSSTNSLKDNFQFLVDINVSGQSNPVSRLTYPKQPNTGQINIDVANVLKDYVTYDLGSFNVTGLLANNSSIVNYWIQFGEIYDNASGVPVIYPDLAQYGSSGSSKKGSNAIFDFLDWSKTAFNSGYALSLSNKKSLNQTSFTPSIRSGQQMWLTFFDLDSLIAIVDIQVFNDSGGSLFTNSYSSLNSSTKVCSFNIGHSFLSFMGASGYLTNPNASYYVVNFKDNGDDDLFEIRVNIDQKCTIYDITRLHWLNHLGGFDSFNFTKVSKDNYNIERKQFKRLQQLNYNKTDRLKTNYYTKQSETIELNTDLLTNEEWEGLLQLVLSPIVIMEVDSNNYVPVNIIDTNYSPNKVVNEQKPTSLKITIEYTYDNYRQAQ